MSVEVLGSPITIGGGGTETWTGCLSSSFNVPADWTIINAAYNVAGNLISGTGLGYARYINGTCAPALDQEVVAVFYQATSGGAGNTGYRFSGPGTRMNGNALANRSGYTFECGFVSGTNPATCNLNFLSFKLIKWNVGVSTDLVASFALLGPLLTTGITFRLVTRQVAGNANNKCYLNADLIYDHTDVAPLVAGQFGFGSTSSCGGIEPGSIQWQYVKARNL